MSDDKRALGGFSQYGEINTRFLQKGEGDEKNPSALSPAVLFSNTPIVQKAPGTFSRQEKTPPVKFGGEILNPKAHKAELEKKEVSIKKEELGRSIDQLLGAIRIVFKTINTPGLEDLKANLGNSGNEDVLRREIDQVAEELDRAPSLANIADVEKKIANLEGRVNYLQNEISEVPLMRADNLSVLLPLISKFTLLQDKADNLLLKKIGKDVSLKINELVSSLDWLKADPSSGGDDSFEDLDKKLTLLKNLIDKEEVRLFNEEQEKVKQLEQALNSKTQSEQEALSLLKELLPLSKAYGHLEKDLTTLTPKITDDAKKQELMTHFRTLEKIKENVETNPTKKDLDLFKEELTALAFKVKELGDEVDKQLAEAKAEKEATLPLDIWSGWPDDRFVVAVADRKNGVVPHWVFIEADGNPLKMNPQESSFWAAERANFTTIFTEYEKFLKNEKSSEKIQLFPELIQTKMNAVKNGILSNNLVHAASLREDFRIKLAEAKEVWAEKIKKEEEQSKISQEKEILLPQFEPQKEVYLESLATYKTTKGGIQEDLLREELRQRKLGLEKKFKALGDSFAKPENEVDKKVFEAFKKELMIFNGLLQDEKKRQEKVLKVKNENKEDLRGKFEELANLHKTLNKLYEEVSEEIHSEDERKLLNHYFDGLATENKNITTAFNDSNQTVEQSSLNNFSTGLSEFSEILAPIQMRLKRMRERKGQKDRPVLRTRFTSSKNDAQPIKLRDGRTITVGEWKKEQGEQEKIKEDHKRALFGEVVKQHKELLTRNPVTYIERYVHQKLPPDDINIAASEQVLKEHVDSLIKQRELLGHYIMTAEEKLADPAVDPKEKPTDTDIKELKYRFKILDDGVRSVKEIGFKRKIASIREDAERIELRKTLVSLNNKEVYSPAQDSSVAHIPIQGHEDSRIHVQGKFDRKQLLEQEERIRQEDLTTKQIEKAILDKKLADGVEPLTEEELARLETLTKEIKGLESFSPKVVSLRDKAVPNHHQGMVQPYRAQTGDETPETNFEEGDPEKNPEKVVPREPSSPEDKERKRNAVKKIMETLGKIKDSKYVKHWAVWVTPLIFAGTVGLTGLYLKNKNEAEVRPPQTLEQLTSWRDYLQTDKTKKFASNFVDKKLGFDGILKEYAKSVSIIANNPESRKRVADIEPYELIHNQSQERIFGLSPDERKDISEIVALLETMVQATQGKERMTQGFRQNDSSFLTPKVTFEQYFAKVFEIVSKVEAEEQKRMKK